MTDERTREMKTAALIQHFAKKVEDGDKADLARLFMDAIGRLRGIDLDAMVRQWTGQVEDRNGVCS